MAIAKLDDGNTWAVVINGTRSPIYIPAPNLKIEHTNVASADSGRTEDGKMHINWVRPDVKKVYLLYNAISGDEKDYMVNLMQGKEFTLYYWDNGVKHFDGYVGECSYEAYSSVHYASEGGIYQNFSINVIEL